MHIRFGLEFNTLKEDIKRVPEDLAGFKGICS